MKFLPVIVMGLPLGQLVLGHCPHSLYFPMISWHLYSSTIYRRFIIMIKILVNEMTRRLFNIKTFYNADISVDYDPLNLIHEKV